MLSGIKNLDIMLGSYHLEREESELSNSVRRPKSLSYNAFVIEMVILILTPEKMRLGVMPDSSRTREKLILETKSICRQG